MIRKYRRVSIIYGGNGRKYADALNKRISEIAEKDRYPINAAIINEKILTRELLADVMRLFKQSEFCVVFLTKEDCCKTVNGEKKRLRQNVVFELGMALIELGRERCFLMSDFDVKDPDFDLPSDMNSLEIRQFKEAEIDEVISDIIETILSFKQNSAGFGAMLSNENLLLRSDYWIDYENIFAGLPANLPSEGSEFLSGILEYWISECNSLPHYDEKCIYLLERIGFLPIFGRTPAAIRFMESAEALIENYHNDDVRYYHGAELLNFTRNLVQCVIDYTTFKTQDIDSDVLKRKCVGLVRKMLAEDVPENVCVNPLIMVAYYDYLGLTYFRVYRTGGSDENLKSAEKAFSSALKYVPKVDLGLKIWEGFLRYNLARVIAELGRISDAETHFSRVIEIRSKWRRSPNYNVTIRNALSSEYFIAQIDNIDMHRRFNLMSVDEAETEYNYVEKELDAYSDIDDKLDRMISLRRLLKEKRDNLHG